MEFILTKLVRYQFVSRVKFNLKINSMLLDIISFGIFKSIRKIEVRLMQIELLKIQFVF